MKLRSKITVLFLTGLVAVLLPARADGPASPAAPIPGVSLNAEHAAAVFCVAYSPDGKRLASASKDNTVKLWDTAAGQCTATLNGHDNAVMSVSWSPDGKTLASGSSDQTIKLWDVAAGQCTATLSGHTGTVNGLSWSPDGKLLASSSSDNSVKLWDVSTGQCTSTFAGHLDEVTSVSFSPEGRTLASSSRDNTIKVWDLATGQCTATLTGHGGPVYRVAWSPDGKTLASGGSDKTIKLWDVATGQSTATLTGHAGAVSSVSWSPDGMTLASGSRDNSLKLWTVYTSPRPAAPLVLASPVSPPPAPPKATPPPAPIPKVIVNAPSGSAVGDDNSSVEVTTIAGSVDHGASKDGRGRTAYFSIPVGVALDGSGNLYVTDSPDSTIRKMTPDGMVTTVAGSSGNKGGRDGSGSVARFNKPQGLAVDGSGNIYVADKDNDTIRKITPEGMVTTVAGSAGNSGSNDGPASEARFSHPFGVAVDGSGCIYVADMSNDTIRKITPDGMVTTVAGCAGIRGKKDGPGNLARFSLPVGVAVDGSANVYVADMNNETIRKIAPDGMVTTLAGSPGDHGNADGIGTAARFFAPYGVAVDARGNIYVADSLNGTIRKITPDGMVTTLAGSAGVIGSSDGAGSSARFRGPMGVAVDGNGNLYVADSQNYTIRKITRAAVVAPPMSGDEQAPAQALKVTVNAASESASGDKDSSIAVTTFAGSAGHSTSKDSLGSTAVFSIPSGVALDGSGNLYVTDSPDSTIRKMTPDGMVTTVAGSSGNKGSTDGPGSAARFNSPEGLEVDGSGNIYVADKDNDTIRKITPEGMVTTVAGSAGNSGSTDGLANAARFSHPYGLALDGSGNLYVADISNDTIRKIAPDGMVTTVAGGAGIRGSTDGSASAARFNHPYGVTVDGSGNLYVADKDNYTIRKITPGGIVTTLAGSSGYIGSNDGIGGAARFKGPVGAAVDRSGNLYVTDMDNDTIRKVTPDGMVTTVAGSAGVVGSSDGTGSSARFRGPMGVAVDGNGNLYVADSQNYTIRKITRKTVVTSPVSDAVPSPGIPQAGQPWVNSLGVKFVPAGTEGVLFSVWDARVKDYALFVQETGQEWPKSPFSKTENDPVVMVSWDDAKAFCDWLTKKEQAEGKLAASQSYRLPTDAEWSKAVGLNESSEGTPNAKANDSKSQGIYPWGTQWPPPGGAGNYFGEENGSKGVILGYRDGYIDTSPVGSFAPNHYGLYDMSGNVGQWCEDYKDSADTGRRVIRGCSCGTSSPYALRSANRNFELPGWRDPHGGFRVVVAVSPTNGNGTGAGGNPAAQAQ